MARTLSFDDVQKHKSAGDCWVILYGKVYDVSSFLSEHPGGSRVILQLAGTDATEAYDPVHPPGTLESSLAAESLLGSIDAATLPQESTEDSKTNTSEDTPPTMTVAQCLNMDEIEKVATQRMSRRAWAYYFSASDDLWSKSNNHRVYEDILLRPRVFINVKECDTRTTILGHKVQVPFFVSPAAQARLAHPEGERGIARACEKWGVCQIISHNASMTPEQICTGAGRDQIFGWQIYVQNDRKKSEASLTRINKIPSVKFVVLTLDAPVPGKRELDEREGSVAATLPAPSTVAVKKAEKNAKAEESGVDAPGPGGGGVGRAMFAGTAADLNWKITMPWLEKHTDRPIVLKGLQTHEDVYMASLYPRIKGVILSNHGGRAADTAPPAIHTLLECHKYCPEVFKKLEIYIDGGIKRGTDIVKALALGARAVGLGRSPLYGLGTGGPEGVERVFEILKAETDTAMRLLGVNNVSQLGRQHVNTRSVERDIYDGPAGLEKLEMWIKSKL